VSLRRAPRSLVGLAALLAAAASLPAAAGQTSLTLGMHRRMALDKEISRVAVGNPSVLGIEVLSSRELLALGKSIGRTNVILWYVDGSTDDLSWTVQRDLSLLGVILRDIHPALEVESAPDRDAIILRGVVPDLRYARLAEAAASAYLSAGGGASGRAGALVLPADAEPRLPDAEPPPDGAGAAGGAEGVAEEDAALDAVAALPPGQAGGGPAIINLIQVGELPATLEERIAEAIRPIGGEEVSVRRIVRGEIPNDASDTFVLEGEVSGQVELSRILISASTVVTGRTGTDIEVLANEAGSLGARGGGGAAAGGGGGFGASMSGRVTGLRGSDVRANIARAKALSAGRGRILAFVHVRDLPQVRVQARVFEVNRTRLKNWLPQLNAVKVDPSQPDQPPLIPPVGDSPGVSPAFGVTAWQMATRILQGALLSQWQVVAGDFALDVLFALLESEGVARSLARPTLTVLSGESALFNVGGAIPIDSTLTTSAGNETFSNTVFQEFGINLSVRPLVGEDDMITMEVSPDLSFPDPALTAELDETTTNGASTTAFETRSLSTSTRLADGQVLVIGGLLQQEESVDSSFTPGVHALPGVGWLAKSLGRTRDETEVVILVGPTIVRDRVEGTELWAYPDSGEMLAELQQGGALR
jgi:Flp pilus assembly secretin CpaC